jgi:uncharacterized protein
MFSLLMPYPAALIRSIERKTLVVADPHLGWEISLQEKGIHIPSQTQKLLKKLIEIISEYKPDSLLILGDVKYTVVASEPGEWHDIPDFFEELKKHVAEIGIVRGNHDANLEPMLPEKIEISPSSGVVVADVGLFHGHKWPSPELLSCKTLIMGHLHPVVVFRDPAGFKLTRQVWIRADCNSELLAEVLLKKHNVKIERSIEETLQRHYKVKLRTKQIFIMPSFNDFLGGRPVNEVNPKRTAGGESLIGPVLRSEAVRMDDSELYLLDGTYLGTLNQFKQF